MALTGEKLTDEIQVLVGRGSDLILIDATRCARWLNEGQSKIVEKCPGIHSLTFKNTTSLDITQSLSYAIGDVTTIGDATTDTRPCHIWSVSYLDGNESKQLLFTHTDEFDALYPDPTHSDIPINRAYRWTRRGGNIEIMPLSACSFVDNDLRFDGDYYPRDFTTNDSRASDISGADDGLIIYGVWHAWEAIGSLEGRIEAARWKKKWSNPRPLSGEDEGWLESFKAQNDNLHEWDGDMYSDLIE